ncbi:MAG: signal peptidase I [Proteobacteria bacterium]|nr:MAG: signal peptidase I [Pseudomonadota bacterium]
MRIKRRYCLFTVLLVIASVASGLTFEQNPFNTAANTFRGRVLGFELFRIPSDSMMPTLMPGDFIWVSTSAYKDKPPQINDVITFLYPKDKSVNYIKRLIGRPGDTVRIENFKVYVNDEEIQQPYLDNALVRKPYSRYMQPVVVPEGSLFVMGDNRDNSNDGRFFGMVKRSDVIGKATLILFGKNNRTGNSIE